MGDNGRINEEELEEAFTFVDDYFFLIRSDGDQLPGSRQRAARLQLTAAASSSSSGIQQISGGGGWRPSYAAMPVDPAELLAEESPTIEWVLEKAKSAVRR